MSTVAPNPVAIEAGDADDLDQVMRIMNAAFDPAFGEAWSRSQCAAMLSQPGTWLTLAVERGRACGFAMCHLAVDEAELLLLAVDPKRRGRGIGEMLIDHCCRQAQTKEVRRIHLEVRKDNIAEHLYRKTGFKPVGRRPKYYCGIDGTRYDAVTLSRELSNV